MTTSAPRSASAGSAVTRIDPPVPAAIFSASAMTPAAGYQPAAERVRVAHVVGAVAEVRHSEPREPPLVLDDGLPVGQDLARVEVVAQRVDDRHARVRGHVLQPCLVVGAPHDGAGHATQHPGGVGW
jgi:hypothetical protein